VQVRIHQAGQHHLAFEVYKLSIFALELSNLIITAYGNELAVLDGHRLCSRLQFVNSVDIAIMVDGVGDLL